MLLPVSTYFLLFLFYINAVNCCDQEITTKNMQFYSGLSRKYPSLSKLYPNSRTNIKADSSTCSIYMSTKAQLNLASWEVWIYGYSQKVLCREYIRVTNGFITIENLKPNTSYQLTLVFGGRFYFMASCHTLNETITTTTEKAAEEELIQTQIQTQDNGQEQENNNKPVELTQDDNKSTQELRAQDLNSDSMEDQGQVQEQDNVYLPNNGGTKGEEVDEEVQENKCKTPVNVENKPAQKEKKFSFNINIGISLSRTKK